ncbi:hypothetical protein J1614_003307 [Plenodomus biglobosus]|nr:hypothetical protein J1614_003307 [Plenodomus biglobosus]
MSAPNEALIRMHHESRRLYELKMKKLQARVFPSGCLPTLTEIYLNPLSTEVPIILPNMQLEYYLSNFTELSRLNFQARKYEPGVHHQTAIFHWQLDPQHSFSSYHSDIRLNVLLAHISLAIPSERAKLETSLQHFLRVFIVAWLNMAMRVPASHSWACKDFVGKYWRHSAKYDLIKFTKQPRLRIQALVRKLEACVPPAQHTSEDFWKLAKLQDPAALEKHGAAWAMQAIVYWENLGEKMDKKKRAADAAASLADGGLNVGIGSLGVGETVPAFLCEELFDQPLVKALLTPVPENIAVLDPEDPNREMSWMKQEDAEEFLKGLVERKQDMDSSELAAAFGEMSFLGA